MLEAYLGRVFSGLIFAKATHMRELADWVNVRADAFEFYGGVTRVLVSDQPRSAATVPDAYELTINHYGTAVGCS